jgi:hypothetical protein
LDKIHDYLYEYRGLWANGARVRVRIYDASGVRPVVIATEPDDNPGASVTNMIEFLSAELVEQHFRDPSYTARTPIFIEHYPPRPARRRDETFDLVQFPLTQPKPVLVGGIWRLSLGDPAWSGLTRAQVERFIGQPFAE